ncbi:hypothetical protein E5093_09685 [Acinetobacter indicus]|uniref:hypothetical protein n=1 Tax=Acinetobacter indicus TaxID=756892 RepID=UPI00159F4705|nr:hypothetical protein [Acinetobacter indicus]QLB59833.1 hypothetical protein E5093_09685 [Acinetobacter indicus]
MSSAELKTFIENARGSGATDTKIFLAIMDSPKFKKGIEKGNAMGMTNRDIAAGLGLNIPRAAVDLKAETQKEVKKQAKAAGKTQAWESALLGASDLGAGVLQGFSYAADGVSGGLNKLLGTNLDTNSYERVTKARKDVDDWHNLRRQENDQGFDGWRLGGQIAGTAPMASLARGYQGANILSKAGAKVTGHNALVGAGIGAASFAEDSNQRLGNTALSAIGGGAGGALGEKVGQGVSRVARGAKNQVARFSTERTNEILRSIDEKLEAALRANPETQGMRLSDLSDEVVSGLRAEARQALQSGKELNPTAVARKAALDQVGIKGTRGQITGDAKQWQQEAELAKLQGVGDDLREKFISDNERLAELLDLEQTATGGRSVDQLGAGRDAAESLLDQYSANKQFVRGAYEAARNAPGNDALINGQGFANDVFTALDDQALATFLPADIRNIVKQINDNPQYFTLRKGEELIKVLNDHYKSSLQMGEPTATTRALGVVRQALQGRQDEALQGLLAQGNDAAQMYQFAREAHRANKSLQVKMPLLQDVLKQQAKGSVNYDDLYKKHILNGKVDELAQTVEVLKNTNPQAVADIQQEVIKDISAKAVNSNGQFSPAGMKRALEALGDRKLNIIFNPDQVKRLKDIRQAGHYAVTQPAHAAVNNSNTAVGVANYLGRVVGAIDGVGKRIPFISNVLTGPIRQAANHNQVSSAMGGGSIASPTQAVDMNSPLIERLVQMGVIAGANDMK